MMYFITKLYSAQDALKRIQQVEVDMGKLSPSQFNVVVVGEYCHVSSPDSFGEALFREILCVSEARFEVSEAEPSTKDLSRFGMEQYTELS
jgi:hypothetical protein